MAVETLFERNIFLANSIFITKRQKGKKMAAAVDANDDEDDE